MESKLCLTYKKAGGTLHTAQKNKGTIGGNTTPENLITCSNVHTGVGYCTKFQTLIVGRVGG